MTPIIILVLVISLIGGAVIFAIDALKEKVSSKRELNDLEKNVVKISDSIMNFYDQFSPLRLDPVMRQMVDLDEQYEILFKKKIFEAGIEDMDIIWHYSSLLYRVDNYAACLRESKSLNEFQSRQVLKKINQYEETLKNIVVSLIKTSEIKRRCTLLLSFYKSSDFAYPCMASNSLEMLPHIVYRLEQKIADGRFDSITDYELKTGARFLLKMNVFLAYNNNEDFKKKYAAPEATLLGYTFKKNSFEFVIGSLSGKILSYLRISPTDPTLEEHFVMTDRKAYKKRVKKITQTRDIVDLVNSL